MASFLPRAELQSSLGGSSPVAAAVTCVLLVPVLAYLPPLLHHTPKVGAPTPWEKYL